VSRPEVGSTRDGDPAGRIKLYCFSLLKMVLTLMLQTLTWLINDGEVSGDVAGIRRQLHNGSLYFPPFTADDYDADIHRAIYRCKASSPVGTILSRRVRLRAGQLPPRHVLSTLTPHHFS